MSARFGEQASRQCWAGAAAAELRMPGGHWLEYDPVEVDDEDEWQPGGRLGVLPSGLGERSFAVASQSPTTPSPKLLRALVQILNKSCDMKSV